MRERYECAKMWPSAQLAPAVQSHVGCSLAPLDRGLGLTVGRSHSLRSSRPGSLASSRRRAHRSRPRSARPDAPALASIHQAGDRTAAALAPFASTTPRSPRSSKPAATPQPPSLRSTRAPRSLRSIEAAATRQVRSFCSTRHHVRSPVEATLAGEAHWVRPTRTSRSLRSIEGSISRRGGHAHCGRPAGARMLEIRAPLALERGVARRARRGFGLTAAPGRSLRSTRRRPCCSGSMTR